MLVYSQQTIFGHSPYGVQNALLHVQGIIRTVLLVVPNSPVVTHCLSTLFRLNNVQHCVGEDIEFNNTDIIHVSLGMDIMKIQLQKVIHYY